MSEKKSFRQRSLEKHIINCPNCGGKELDHMTKCRHCGCELTPKGYNGPMMEPGTQRKVKLTVTIVLSVIAVVAIVLLLISRNS